MFQITATLVSITNIHKQTDIAWKDSMRKSATVLEKSKKEKEVVESQFVVLESERTTFFESLEETKEPWDEVVAMATSL